MQCKNSSPDNDPSPWYLVQLKPGGLATARRNLARQGIAVFCPMTGPTGTRQGRAAGRPEPLFPGYLFVRSAGGGTLPFRAVNNTYGVARLVSFGTRPAETPARLITDLARGCDEDGVLRPPRAFATGDVVRIQTGPFADFVATVTGMGSDARVWMLLDVMQRATRVAIPAADLRKIA